LTLSEWCRETLLANVNGQEEKSADPGGTGQALMAELVALRTILLNVLFKQANGEGSKDRRVSIREKTIRLDVIRERVQQFVDRGGDLKAPDAVPLGIELIHAFDDLAKGFGQGILKPIKKE